MHISCKIHARSCKGKQEFYPFSCKTYKHLLPGMHLLLKYKPLRSVCLNIDSKLCGMGGVNEAPVGVLVFMSFCDVD